MKFKDCTQCPSYTTNPDLINGALGRPINAPICVRYGHVLGVAGQALNDESEMLKFFAENCPSFGEDMPDNGVPVSINLRVAVQDDATIAEGPTGMACGSCHACSHCVQAEPISRKFGWVAPVCDLFGMLITSPRSMAQACEYSKPGVPGTDASELKLLPHYRAGFEYGSQKVLDAMLNNGNLAADPRTYPSDAPVEPEDAADGIRAWRELESPYGDGETAVLPIFDPSIFTEAERSLIPQLDDVNHPELYIDYSNLLWKFATDVFEDDETLCIQGAPGLGKTEFARWVAWLMQVPFRRIMIGPGSDPEDLFGKAGAKDGSTYFHKGRFTIAFEAHAGILCVDEPNTGLDEVTVPMRSTTDNSKQLTLDASYESEDKIVCTRGKYTFQLWCMNQSWDIRNVGTRDLAMADMSRLTPVVVPYPPEVVERRIVKDACKAYSNYDLPDKILDDIMKVSKLLREASDQGEYPGSWGIREQIKVAKKTRRHPFVEAYRLAALYFFEPSMQQYVIDNFIKTVNADGI